MAHILIINTGSKTIKFELFNTHFDSLISGTIDDENGEQYLRTRSHSQISEYGNQTKLATGEDAFERIKKECGNVKIDKIGFRIVHGGEKYGNPTKLTPGVIEDLEKLNELAPLHNPSAVKAVKKMRDLFPQIPLWGVFDTAFHKSIKKEQFLYALPYEYYEKYKVRRYGFHGISNQYVSDIFFELEPQARKIIVCHLGSGSSVTAILDGNSFDTSMGFTPLEGLMMTTRAGDVDDGALDYLRRKLEISNEEMMKIENTKSGLLGISGISFDMRTLLDEEANGNERARLAIEMFVYRIKKYIGAYIAAMGGVDGLLFTAGIGAGSDVLRHRIIEDLSCANLEVDDALNTGQINVEKNLKISTPQSKPIWVIPTDEEFQIAKEINTLS